MNRRLPMLVLFLTAAGRPFSAAQIPAEVIRSEEYQEEIQTATGRLLELKSEHHIPGITISVGWKDDIIWAEGFGEANLETHEPVSAQTRFRIGSTSKSLTGVLLMRLVQEGKMNLDATVDDYMDYFPEKKYPITIRQLASHQADIRHYNMQQLEFMSNLHYETVHESLNAFKQDSLIFKPDSRYAYSTYGYVLLSACMERAAGEEYLALMKNRMFQPLGMWHTVPDYHDSVYRSSAVPYDFRNGSYTKGAAVSSSGKWAGGGFLSTPADLVQLGLQLLQGHYLNESSLKTLWRSNTLQNGDSTGYAIGFRTGRDSLGRRIVHHGGQPISGRAFLLIYPAEKLVVAIACNTGATFAEQFAEKIAECFLKPE